MGPRELGGVRQLGRAPVVGVMRGGDRGGRRPKIGDTRLPVVRLDAAAAAGLERWREATGGSTAEAVRAALRQAPRRTGGFVVPDEGEL